MTADAEQDLQTAAARALQEALDRERIADPRESLRDRLRALRGTAHFDRVVAHYQEALLPGVAEGTMEPLDAWLEYARLVAGVAPGRETAIDVQGREGADPSDPATLLLHVPEEKGAPVTRLRAPADASPAQRATLALLVDGRTRLP